MTHPLFDLSGNIVPPAAARTGALPHVIAVAPNRVYPPRDAVEFLFHGFYVGAAGIVKMANPNGATLFVPPGYQGHIDYLIAECTDLDTGTFPNNAFAALAFNAGLSSNRAWQVIPFLSTGSTVSLACTLNLPMHLDIPPATIVELYAANVEASVRHFDMYVHGWTWPTSDQD